VPATINAATAGCRGKRMRGPGSKWAKERKGQGAKVPGSERARQRLGQGAKVPRSELARVLLANSLRGANWPGSKKAVNQKNNSKFANIDDVKCFVAISDITHPGPCAKEVIFGAALTD